jgi:tetratricopeptide (TPR) repeat protein
MSECLTPETLAQVLAGALGEPEASSVSAHLASCDTCRALLDQASDEPDLRGWASATREAPLANVQEPGLDQLLQRLCTPPDGVREKGEAVTHFFLGPPRREGDLGTLGPYRVQAEVGRGGMGIVLRGYDDALHRTVAIKVLRPELVTETTRVRLLYEARASARFQHEHVVQIYAAGSTPEGLPYLAMEFLAGSTLAQRIHAQPALQPREVAAVILKVAEGLSAAHAAGLVHRDIKPSNIILEDQTGRPKILDFGLARIRELSTGMTQEGTVAGTPTYMSPEQIQGLPEIDGRSDVYSLGVTFYEALTGEAPFRGKSHLVLQQVLREEPRPPSQLNDTVPRDLETICLKAMAKEPGRRYQTAQELANDLRRWQQGEPIRARPVGKGERFARWCRRNPRVAGLSAALLLVFLGGFAGVFWQWQRAESNFEEMRQQKTLAEQNFRLAQEAVDDYLTRVSENRLLNEPGMQPLRRELLEGARQYYVRFVNDRRDDRHVQGELGRALFRLGTLTWDIDSPVKAREYFQQALEIRERLAGENPADIELQADLAHTYNNLANCTTETWDFLNAVEIHRRGLAVSQALIAQHPEHPAGYRGAIRTNNNLGLILDGCGRETAAEEAYRDSIAAARKLREVDPKDPLGRGGLANTAIDLANLYQEQGRLEDAQATLQEALTAAQSLCREFPEAAGAQVLQANCSARLLIVQAVRARMGPPEEEVSRLAAAEVAFQKIMAELRRLAAANPAMTEFQRVFAQFLTAAGEMNQALDRPAQAEAVYREALTIVDKLARAYPRGMTFAVARIPIYIHLGNLQSDWGRLDLALESYDNAEHLLKQFPTWIPRYAYYGPLALPLRVQRAMTHTEARRYQEAMADWNLVLANDGSQPHDPWKAQDGKRHHHLWQACTAVTQLHQSGNEPVPLYHEGYTDAVAEAENYQQTALLPGSTLYWLAMVHSLAAQAAATDKRLATEERQQRADKYATLAVQLLARARLAGYFRAKGRLNHLKQDKELATLRSRADFQAVLRSCALAEASG